MEIFGAIILLTTLRDQKTILGWGEIPLAIVSRSPVEPWSSTRTHDKNLFIIGFFFVFVFVFLPFLGLHPRHMEVPGLEV